MAERGEGEQLLRVLGAAFGVAVVVGGSVGQGILRTPGLVAQSAPDVGLILGLWTLGGLMAFIDVMSIVELASSVRRTGGPYVFIGRAFGPFAGLAAGIADWLANIGSIAFVTVVFGEYLHRLGIALAVPVGVLALLLTVAVGGVQWFGTKVGGRSQEVGSAVKAALFVLLIAALMLAPRGAPVATAGHATAHVLTLSGFAVAMRGIFGTYTGYNSAAYFTEEVRDPRRTVVRATFVGLAVVTAIYVLCNLAFLRVLTPAQMAGSQLVAADAAARVFGPAANPFVTAVSLISLVTITNVTVMIYPRVVFAVARDAGLSALTHVAPNGTPRAALLLTVLGGGLLALVGVYDILVAFSVSLMVFLGAAVNAAAMAVRWREPELERPWRMPLFPLPALVAMAVNLGLCAMFVHEDPATSAKAFGLLAVLAAAAYLLTRRARLVAGALPLEPT